MSLGNQAAEVERSWPVAKQSVPLGVGLPSPRALVWTCPLGPGLYLSPEPFSARRLWES